MGSLRHADPHRRRPARRSSRTSIEGVSARDEFDEATGISSKVVIDWRSTAKGSDLKPAISVLNAKGVVVKTYALPVGAILSITDGDDVTPGQDLARMPTGGAKTRDITGGLPRVAELFEARRPKDHAIIAESDGRVEFGKDYKNKRRLRVVPEDESLEAIEYMIPKGKHIPVQEGDFVKKGDYLLDGNPAPQDILSILGVEALANYLVEEIQKVYRLQGVPINDKHIEVIVRQMLQKVEIMESGDTEFLKGEAVEALDLEDENKRVKELGLTAGDGAADAARHHQGELANAFVHLGRVVPGNHARAHRSRFVRQVGHARRLEGKRHRRASHPGGHGRPIAPLPEARRRARRATGDRSRGRRARLRQPEAAE